MQTIKKNLHYVISLLYIFSIFTCTISNYKTYSFFLKFFSILSLFTSLFLYIKWNKIPKNILIPSKKKYCVIIALSSYLFLSILYSLNPYFGSLKWINFVLFNIPLVYATYIFLQINSKSLWKGLYWSNFAVTLFVILSVLLFHPFSYMPGIVSISQWSHVIIGRYLCFSFSIFLITHFLLNNKKKLIHSTTILVMIVIGTYLSGHRASFLGISIVSIIILAKSFFSITNTTLKAKTFRYYFLVSVLLLTALHLSGNNSSKRFHGISELTKSGKTTDTSIEVRLEAYEKSFEKFLAAPLFGYGLGGYNENIMLGELLIKKYPHNIILEIAFELGILGIFLFGWIFYLIIRNLKSNSILVVIFILAFWLSLFSKDLTTQPQLFIFLAFVGFKNIKNTSYPIGILYKNMI